MPRALRILIVEDSETDSQLVLAELRLGGFAPEFRVVDSEKALRAALQERWDVVLSDYVLPSLNGLKAIEIVRESDPDVPILLMSGKVGEEIIVQAMKSGADDYLVKDNLTRLCPTIGRELREAENRRKRRLAEEALSQKAKEIETLLAVTPTNIWIAHDPECRRVTVNAAASRLLGIPVEDSFSIDKSIDPFSKVSFSCQGEPMALRDFPLQVAARDGVEVHNCEIEVLFDKNQARTIYGSAFPLADDGKTRGAIAAFLDITERKKIEQDIQALNKNLEEEIVKRSADLRDKEQELQQARKLEAVGQLAGGVAHDFNNLITGILGVAQEVLTTFPPDDHRREELGEIIKASNRAFTVTKQLLTFARKEITQPTVLDLHMAIHDIHKLLARLIREDISIELDLRTVGLVKMDPSHLEQVLINLAVNSRDAMPNGGVITIRIYEEQLPNNKFRLPSELSPGRYAVLEFADTGLGMSAATMSRIFEPFFTTKDKDKGTGLGLATIYGIVKQNYGEIRVESELNEGTQFFIYIPITTEKIERLDTAKALPVSSNGSEQILVVEDEEIVRHVTIRMLKRAGYQVLSANNGKEAIALLAKQKSVALDLILTDIVMPGMNGRELVDHIRLIHPKADVLFMSGYTEDIIGHRGVLDEGINFIEKASINKGLLIKVREILDKKKTASSPSAT